MSLNSEMKKKDDDDANNTKRKKIPKQTVRFAIFFWVLVLGISYLLSDF